MPMQLRTEKNRALFKTYEAFCVVPCQHLGSLYNQRGKQCVELFLHFPYVLSAAWSDTHSDTSLPLSNKTLTRKEQRLMELWCQEWRYSWQAWQSHTLLTPFPQALY